MEAWREELYHSELYHYGVKGMKWGKHLFGKDDLKNLWQKRITGNYYKRGEKAALYNARALTNLHRNNWHLWGRPYERIDDQWRSADLSKRDYETKSLGGRVTTSVKNAPSEIGYHKDNAVEAVKDAAWTVKDTAKDVAFNADYAAFNLKWKVGEIKDSAVKKAQSWISSTSSVAKKKVSDIKDKIAWAEKGKQTIHSVGSSKSGKSSGRMHAETVFPSKSQNSKKYQEQKDRYKKSVTKKSTGRKTVTDYGVSGTFRTYYKRK